MGIEPLWRDDVLNSLTAFGIPLEFIKYAEYTLLLFKDRDVIINLVALNNKYNPSDLVILQDHYQSNNTYLLHLWEDVWQTRKLQVTSRIASVLGLNKRIHARKTNIITITQKQADEFLKDHHLQASATSKYRFALCINDQIIAVACFSNIRYMKRIANDYRSAELIRFASQTGVTVTGGFSKLLKHFIILLKPNDVMSYADRDWSLGKAYEQSGFTLSSVTLPSYIWLNVNSLTRYFPHRLPAEAKEALTQYNAIKGDNKTEKFEEVNVFTDTNDNRYIKVFNTGNLKYILYL